jgi:hypothetical protein
MTGLRIDSYEWHGGREAMLRLGPDHAPLAIIAPALFEEANRTRAFTLAIARALVNHGIGVAIPDLPGQGESVLRTDQASLADWRAAFAAATAQMGGQVHGIAIRGGAIVDTDAELASCWRLSPITGQTVLSDLRRASRHATVDGEPSTLAGNRLAARLVEALEADETSPSTGGPVRTVRLDIDPRPADRHVAGSPLWRRSEPGNDPPLAATLAADIAQWITSCGG